MLDSDKSVSVPLSPGSHMVQAKKGNRLFKKQITVDPGKTTNLPIRLPLPVAEPSTGTKAKFQEGVTLFEQFKFDDSIKKFNEAAAMEPAFPDTYAYIGRAEMRAGRPAKAAAAYDKVLELDPNNTRTMALKAEALVEQGDLGGAEELLKQAVSEDTEDDFAPLVLGYTYYMDNKYEEAQNYLQTSINRDPTNPMGYLQMSHVLHALNDRDGAEAAARKSIQLFNEFPKQQEKTSAWKSVFMSTKIRKFFDQNGLADAHLRLGVLLLEKAVGDPSRGTDQGALSEAIANIEKAQNYAESSGNKYLLAQAIYYRSEIYSKNQDFDRAIKGYQQALQNNAELAQPYRGLSWCYEKQQKFYDALDSYQKFMERLNKTEYEQDRAQIDRRLKRLQELARAHAKK
jgi:tetratricopeptide (TPR) repeat protein